MFTIRTSTPVALTILLLAVCVATAEGQARKPDLAVLDSIAGAGVAENRVAGTVAAVVRDGETLLMEGYGRADVEWDVPMTTDAMFEVGSIAKQFTAASILQLRDEGKLELEDEVTKWLPELDAGDNRVTLRHLLSHTSGINHFSDNPEFEINWFAPRFPRDSAMSMITLEPYQFPTGEAQAYNNSGFWLLGLVVEKASGMKLEEYLRSRIFEPLGMTRSMYCDGLADVPRRAHGYRMLGPVRTRAPMVHYTWVFAPGAVCSTAGDLVKWLQALHGGEVLLPESYTEMTTPARLGDGTAVQYGLGIKVGEDSRGLRYIGHGGTAPGFRSDATWYPEARMAVVVLMNTSPANISPGSVGSELAGAVLPLPHPEMPRYTDDAAPFVGTYEWVVGGNRGSFDIEVSSTPTGLGFALNGGRPAVLPWAGGLTFYGSDNVTLTFHRANGDDGPVTELHRDDAGNHYILRKR